MDLIEKVRATIKKHNMLYGGERVLIALSGGADSVCLLHILSRLAPSMKLTLAAMYIDHGLRPEDVPAEIEFCRQLCQGLGVELLIDSVPVARYASRASLSIQEAARELRYQALQQKAVEMEMDRIATGHNADDQAETLIMRLIRGAGMRGLSGIPPVRGNIIRPLIAVTRQQIEAYLRACNVSFINDPSNQQPKYLRNRVRKILIPALKEFNPNIIETLSHEADILREEDAFIERFVNQAIMRLISRKTSQKIELFLAPMEAMETVILRRVLRKAIDQIAGLRRIGYKHIESIIDIIHDSPTGSRLNLPEGLRVIKGYSTLILTTEPPKKVKEHVLQIPGETFLNEVSMVLVASLSDRVERLGDGKYEAVFDFDTLKPPLRIRSRMEGDFFYPFGLGKKKKLQDFFVDEKVPKEERDSIPILTTDDNEIVWIVGYRIDERFKVTSSTRRFLTVMARLIDVKET